MNSIDNPHSYLGLHLFAEGQVIRMYRPGAEWISLEVKQQLVDAKNRGDGVFEYVSQENLDPCDYRVYHSNGLLSYDPYAFPSTIDDESLVLFNQGKHPRLYEILGAHYGVFFGVRGVRFSVWAPNAIAVGLVGEFNHWDGRVLPMRVLGSSGVWELFVPGLGEGEKYKFEIRTREGYLRVKSDPMAFYYEMRPLTASIVADLGGYFWNDRNWMDERELKGLDRPIRIYEVHLSSWRRYDAFFPNYRQVARDLAQYAKQMHFTHVELLPVMEHPLDESWGYQVTGFFAPTSRYGSVADFQFLVDHLHQEGIGVILDWVPAHFPTDDYSLNRFDGTALYEHEDPRKGIHPHWNTAIFNYGRLEVANFLIASALFWCEKMHVDGLRVDAVASLLYLDYGRQPGEWIPNPDGSNHNRDAIAFLKNLNTVIHETMPGVLMIAEESSSFQGVTHPVSKGGLGFDLKWNMGWMNDTLRYFSKDPIYRRFHQNDLTFSLLYAFSERFLSVFSHDEVVHGKQSLLSKMPGTDAQKFANLRLLYSYMMCHPGKKLIFMGGELGQKGEWDSQGQVDWFLLQYPLHQGLHRMVRELNAFSEKHKALWECDFGWEGFEWIDFSDAERSIVSYLRKASGKALVCVHNFTPERYDDYRILLPHVLKIQEAFNTDAVAYGGTGVVNETIRIEKECFLVSLAPLSTQVFEVEVV